jgi:hypothetical protein
VVVQGAPHAEIVARNFSAAVIVLPGVRIRAVLAVLVVGLLALPACGTAERVVAPPGVRRQARVARAELARAGWRVTLVLPAYTTRVCGDHRTKVRMSVSAIAPGVAAAPPMGHPHLTAFLFPNPQEAATCLTEFLAASGAATRAEAGPIHVVHPPTAERLAARAGRYLVIASTQGPLAPMRRAAVRALARLAAI